MPDRIPSEKENQLAEQASIAESNAKIAEAQVKIIQAQKELAVLNAPKSSPSPKEIAEANAAILAAEQKAAQSEYDKWKAPDVKALDGTLKSEGTFIESQMLAAKTLNKAFNALVNTIEEKKLGQNDQPLSFVIYHAADIPAVQMYYSVLEQVNELTNNFTSSIKQLDTVLHPPQPVQASMLGGAAPAPLLAGYAAAGVLRSVIDVVSLFRTNISVVNKELPVEETNLVASFTHAALNKKWKVWNPAMVPVDMISGSSKSKFITVWHNLRILYNQLNDQIAETDAQIGDKQTDLAAVDPTDQLKRLSIIQRNNALTEAKIQASGLLPVFEQLDKLLATADASSNLSVQSSLIRAEKLIAKLSEENTFLIKLAAVSRGSDKVSQSLFRSATIKHAAGSAISCLIFHKEGHIVFAQNTHKYIGNKDAEAALGT